MVVSKDNARIQITISKDLKQKLELKSAQSNRSVSNYIVTLIIKDLEESSPKI